MDFKTYEERAATTALYPGRRAGPVHSALGVGLSYVLLGLNGEAGECAEQLKKAIRDDGGTITPERRRTLVKELGDVLWYLAAAAHEVGVPLDEIAAVNLDKLARRKQADTLGGSGNDR